MTALNVQWIDRADRLIARTMWRYGHAALRYALAAVFIWFGALKVVGVSPARELVARTVYWLDPDWFVPLLGWWEVAIGVCLLIRPLIRLGILLLIPQLAGTFLPIVLLPEVVFVRFPHALTLEGQFIVKNLVILAAGLVIGGTVRRPENQNERL